MKKSLLFLLVLSFMLAFLPAVQAQEYRITETELTQLESILTNWEHNKQSLQLQVQKLKTELSEAHSLSESLNKQLRTERETSNALRQSYSKYEKEAAQTQAELNTEKLLHKKTKSQRNTLLIILIGEAVLFVAFVVLKIVIKVYKPF